MLANRWRSSLSITIMPSLLSRNEHPIHRHLSCLNIPLARQRRTACHQPSNPTPASRRCSRHRGPYPRHPARCKHRFKSPVCRWPFAAWNPVQSTRCAFLGHWWERAWLVDWAGLGWTGEKWCCCFRCWLLVGGVRGISHRMRMSGSVLGRARCDLLYKAYS